MAILGNDPKASDLLETAEACYARLLRPVANGGCGLAACFNELTGEAKPPSIKMLM